MKQGLRIMGQRMGLLAAALLCAVCSAQSISFGDAPNAAVKKSHVVFLSDGVSVDAGKAEFVELRFRIEDGYHINSHTPKDPLLIPTNLKVDSNGGVKVLEEEYPAGHAFQLGQGSDAMSLNVYQGEFRVRVKLLAQKGPQTLSGSLHYQACDDSSCFPPKTLDLKVAVTAK